MMEHARCLTKIEQAAQAQVPEHRTEPFFDPPTAEADYVVVVVVAGGPADYDEVPQSSMKEKNDSSARSAAQLLAERQTLLS